MRNDALPRVCFVHIPPFVCSNLEYFFIDTHLGRGAFSLEPVHITRKRRISEANFSMPRKKSVGVLYVRKIFDLPQGFLTQAAENLPESRP